jgi:LacI family transcriptional regulator
VATRADVARMAGVSPSVVSYVINKGPRPVSREAGARVAAAIEALDYRPNAIASALRGGSTKSIGLLMPSPVNPYFAELADAIERKLFEAGNLLSIGIIDDDAARERIHLRSLIDRRVDGIILTSSRALRSLSEAQDDVPPVVVIDRLEASRRVSSVHSENVLDSAYAVEHLQSWGHSIIGCITGPRPIPVSAERMRGWSEQQARMGFPNGTHLVAHAEFSTRGGAEAAHTLLGRGGRAAKEPRARPTAVFVASDAQAHGVLHACDELGLRVPQDLSIVSFDGTQSARFTRPPLTAMRQPIPEMGATAARVLLEMVADPKRPPQTAVFRSNLVLGGSCAPPLEA